MPFSRVTLPLLLVACALVLGGCGGGGHGEEIVFVSTRDGDYALFGMDANGSNQGRISDDKGDPETTTGLLYQIDPAWSPDGTQLAFASKRGGSLDVYVMEADGTDVRRLTSTKQDDLHPTWSADGGRIAFARAGVIYTMKADGSDVKRLTNVLAEESDPAWSPDGDSIAYARRIPGTNITELWVSPATGGTPRRITSLSAQSFTPAWAPDGRTLAFATNHDSARYAIFRIGIDGKGLRRVSGRSTSDAFEPTWSPDGSQLAFSRNGAIVSVTESGDETGLTDPDTNDSSPAWRPVTPEV